MTSSRLSPLEALPLLVLERISEYLVDDSEKRRSLQAFSLTSQCCCAAAVVQRFRQVPLRIQTCDELQSGVRRWTDVLNRDGRYRYVRRLKISWTSGEEQRQNKDLIQDENIDDVEEYDDWRTRHYFDMHNNNFCRPSKDCINGRSTGGSIADHDEGFVFLGHLISQLSGLQDLVWACGPNLPHSLLSTIAARGCRLHMHNFRLNSAVHSRDSPRPISIHDYALATAPYLFSIVLRTSDYAFPNKLDYNIEVVNRMVAGMAPNLAHLCLQFPGPGGSLEAEQAVGLGKPAWSGFFPPGTAYGDQVSVRGKLQSLVFASYLGHGGIDYWGRLTDFTQLRCLIMLWRLENGLSLANMAQRGDFEKLDTLGLSRIEDETEQAQEALNRLLENLGPLQRLSLSGYLSPETFDGLLRIHGRALRNLSLYPYQDEDLRNPLVNFSGVVVERLVGQCPNLEQIWLPINRTRGDNRETGIYRALSRLPRLERAFLRLHYTVGPDEEYWDEERDGEHPISNSSPVDIPFVYLREAFSNSAIDANLALSIFNLISSGGSMRYLRLEPTRKMGRNAPGMYQSQFMDVLRWFNRSWICRQDVRGRTTVGEVHKDETAEAGLEWQYLFSDEEKGISEEIYTEVFKDIWPQKTPEWWKDWTSLPLSLEAAKKTGCGDFIERI